MAQMTIVERNGIEDGLRRGWTIPEIAAYVKRSPQTVTNEIKNRRISSSKGLRETNSTCRPKKFYIARVAQAEAEEDRDEDRREVPRRKGRPPAHLRRGEHRQWIYCQKRKNIVRYA